MTASVVKFIKRIRTSFPVNFGSEDHEKRGINDTELRHRPFEAISGFDRKNAAETSMD